MTEDLKKVYKWHPTEGDYIKNDAMESSISMQKSLNKKKWHNILLTSVILVLFIGSILYFTYS